MRTVHTLLDERIGAKNYLIEIEIREYLPIAKEIINSNELQRRRVSSSKTVYSLLKEDILKGCVIPPIVLALSSDIEIEHDITVLHKNLSSLTILDGLQRSHSLIDMEKELELREDAKSLDLFYSRKLRCEIYSGINKIGTLYRMLTLNTGQTPMSLRQQVEMLYMDYLKKPINGIVLVKESDETVAAGYDKFNFKETIEGFNSYLERNELPIERSDILENIKSMEKLSHENKQYDLFSAFLLAWHDFLTSANKVCGDETLDQQLCDDIGDIWGKNVLQIFKKQQAIAGFGAAIGKLKDIGRIADPHDISNLVKDLKLGAESPEDMFVEFSKAMSFVNVHSKKIGNAQRMFFQYYFRELFNSQGDGYLNLHASIQFAQEKYVSQVL